MYSLRGMKRHVLIQRKAKKKAPKPRVTPAHKEILDRGKAIADQALGRLLDAVEKDPEAVVAGAEKALNSIGRIAAAAGELKRWAKENPEEAREKLREAVLKGIASVAKQRREERG